MPTQVLIPADEANLVAGAHIYMEPDAVVTAFLEESKPRLLKELLDSVKELLANPSPVSSSAEVLEPTVQNTQAY